jgi:hypothetical protein
MAVRPTSRPARVIAGVVGAVTLLFVVAGAAMNGPAGALGMAGLAALLIGVGAAIAGRAHWAFISSRRIGGIVAAAGLAALLVGTAVTPPTPSTAATADAAAQSSAFASRTPDQAEEDAAKAAAEAADKAEKALMEAETAEKAVPVLDTTTGVLSDGSAAAAIEAAARTTALAALAAVPVKGRAPRTGYDRDNFGAGWVDVDRNGCDTRNDILARDLTGETFKPGTRNCVVLTGTLADPYSPRTINFQRGQGTSDDVQIDHVVALSDAWQKGAQRWDADRRTAFANDQLNLLAVDGPLNQQKGDGDAATWLPPNTSYRCAYVARQVAVKAGYGLWVTRAERNAAATVLAGCPDEPLPGVPPDVGTRAAPAPTGTVYADCDAVRAAGAAPIRRGEPGWSDAFDGDGDGVGCE